MNASLAEIMLASDFECPLFVFILDSLLVAGEVSSSLILRY